MFFATTTVGGGNRIAMEAAPVYNVAVAQGETEKAIENRLRDFYSWYIGRLIAEPQFPKEEKDKQRLRRELTRSFARDLKRLREEAGGDPLLCAQDFFGEWSFEIHVTMSSTSTALIVFGPPPTKLHRILVTLREENSVWKIDKVQPFVEPERK